MIERELKLIAGNANPVLAHEIATSLGIDLCDAGVDRFSDGEVRVRIRETVRGADVFVIQPTCPPVNEHLMELLLIIDAVKRASARTVIAVVPYYGYARQDRKHTGRVPISARLVANLIETAGADRMLTMDLHAGQIQGFFNIPVDNLRADWIFADHIRTCVEGLDNAVIVAPDAGGAVRARMVAEQLDLPLAILEKRRSQDGSVVSVMNVIGDVAGKNVILVDDIISSGGTLVKAACALHENGALSIRAYATHGIFSGDAWDLLAGCPLKRVVVTNTIFSERAEKSGIVDYISVGEHLAKTIHRIFEYKSVSHLFPHY
ncbi:MAG: ribose-phosphate pyrophosphokinase [Candidatus Bipolaricaulota bacterium]